MTFSSFLTLTLFWCCNDKDVKLYRSV